MKQTVLFILSLILFLIFGTVFHENTYASTNRYAKILGVTTSSQQLSIPPTIEGPGLILPDSPFFFLDQLKQKIRIYTAFNPETKAKIYTDIAGERFAELRFMLVRNNKTGIEIALDGVKNNLDMAATETGQAQMRGKDVSKLAKTINDSIKGKQEALDQLQLQTTGELKARVESTQESLLSSKVKVEDLLALSDLDNEIRYDLARQIKNKVSEASNSAEILEGQINELNKQVEQASQQMLAKREDALKKTIQQKNDALVNIQEQLLEQEKDRQTKLLGAQTVAMEQAKEAVANIKKATEEFKKAQQTISEIENPTADFLTPTPIEK